MVYGLEKYDLKVMFTHLDQKNPDVVVTLGSEAQTFQLEGFTNFWLDMLKVGRKAADAHLVLTGFADSIGKDGHPLTYGSERRGLKIAFSHLDHNKPDVVVTMGSEARTFQLEDFIDFWLEMTELVPKAVYAHLVYLELLARQRRASSRGTGRSRKSMGERRSAKQQAVEERGGVKTNADVVWLISSDALATYTEDGAVVQSNMAHYGVEPIRNHSRRHRGCAQDGFRDFTSGTGRGHRQMLGQNAAGGSPSSEQPLYTLQCVWRRKLKCCDAGSISGNRK